MNKTIKNAEGRWPDILARLGIDESFLINRHGPCPICGGVDRYRFDDKSEGAYFCGGCGPGFGIDLVMKFHGWDFAKAAAEVDKVLGVAKLSSPQKPKKDPRIRLNMIRQELQPVTGSINPVRLYLRSRGFSDVPPTLRYHPAMRYYDQGSLVGTYPAMVALVVSPDGKPVTYHVTHLDQHGRKAAVPAVRKILPPARGLPGGAIRLAPAEKHLGVAEGIETAMAVTRDYGIPCWAVLSTSGMESFDPPPGIERVTIFSDNDERFAGQKSAFILANRLASCVSRCYIVSVEVPSAPGDFADISGDRG